MSAVLRHAESTAALRPEVVVSTPLVVFEPGRPAGRRWDRVGRSLMGVNALLTLGAVATGVAAMADAEQDRLMVEGWRTFGYLVFAAMWTLLAIAPRRLPAVWEVVLVQKTLVTTWAIVILGAPESVGSATIDSWLVLSTLFAYVVCRGWTSWRVLGASQVD